MPEGGGVVGQVKQARQDSSGVLDFCRAVINILFETIGCAICLGLTVALPVSMLIVGAIHLKDCPAERLIPIYLLVGGILGISKNVIMAYVRWRREKKEETPKPLKAFIGLLQLVILSWFIAGCVWVYRLHNRYNPNSKAINYCHDGMYKFAFWLNTIVFIIMIIVFVFLCCICCFALCFGTEDETPAPPQQQQQQQQQQQAEA